MRSRSNEISVNFSLRLCCWHSMLPTPCLMWNICFFLLLWSTNGGTGLACTGSAFSVSLASVLLSLSICINMGWCRWTKKGLMHMDKFAYGQKGWCIWTNLHMDKCIWTYDLALVDTPSVTTSWYKNYLTTEGRHLSIIQPLNFKPPP